MKGRRSVRIGAALCVVATAAFGLGTTGIASAQKGGSNQFKNLKTIKEPSPCRNDPGITDTEIKVGVIAPMTGPLSGQGFFPQIVDAVEARVNAANANKELGNRQIKLVTIDDQGDPSRNTTAAQNLIEQEKVFAIITESPAGESSAKYLNEQGIPVVGWQLGLPMFGTYPNIFGFQNANTKDIRTNYTSRNADVMKLAGGKNIALVASNQGNSAIFIEQIADAVERTKGLKVAYKTTDVPVGTTEFGSYAQQIKDSGADAMYTGLATAENIALLNALKQAGANVKTIILPAGYDPRVTGIPAFDGAYIGIEFKPLETTPAPPGMTAFRTAMGQYKPSNPINQSAAVGWLSGNAFIEGIKAAGVNCPTRKAFINNLRMEKGYTADGWFEPISFADVYNKPFECVYYVQIVNKAFTPAFGGEPVCAKQIIKNNKLVNATSTTTAAAGATTTTAAR